jgi:hypothetical protein
MGNQRKTAETILVGIKTVDFASEFHQLSTLFCAVDGQCAGAAKDSAGPLESKV